MSDILSQVIHHLAVVMRDVKELKENAVDQHEWLLVQNQLEVLSLQLAKHSQGQMAYYLMQEGSPMRTTT